MSAAADRSAVRRAAMADQLQETGAIRTPGWRDAVLAVPREAFLPRFYDQGTNADGFSEYRPVTAGAVGADGWLDLVYQDQTWVTQLDHDDTSWDPPGTRTGTPTSSSTRPGVVVRMLEDLAVDDGMRVLEAGTGTGYSTALTCARLGDSQVVSVEHDQALSERAGERLASLGYQPTLVVGDGAAGHPLAGPYDRIIATYSPTTVPATWLRQMVPGGAILVALAGGLDTYGYVRLTVGRDLIARGTFINGDISFMPSRTDAASFGPLMRSARTQRQATAGRPSRTDPQLLDTASFRWAAQLFVPDAKLVTTTDERTFGRWLLTRDGSWAVVETSRPDGATLVHEGGAQPLWTRIEAAAEWWHRHDQPSIEKYHLYVTPEQQVITVAPSVAGDAWTRPS